MAKCTVCGGEFPVVDNRGYCPTCAATVPVGQPSAGVPGPQVPAGGPVTTPPNPAGNVPPSAPAETPPPVPGETPVGGGTPPVA